eukprot:g59042.t1
MAWRGLAWHDMTWLGITWRGVTWRSLAWHDMTWRGNKEGQLPNPDSLACFELHFRFSGNEINRRDSTVIELKNIASESNTDKENAPISKITYFKADSQEVARSWVQALVELGAQELFD